MERVFGIVPSSSGPYVFTIILGVVLLAVIGLLIFISYSARHVTFSVSDQGLRIGPSLYGRLIPREKIVAEGVRVINLKTDQEYQPKWRTNGAGLPGYAEGWFKLKNKEKALLFVTDRSSVVYIPTTDNYSVLLSVREADEFAELMKHWERGK
jgi:hypothetical protein